MPPFKDIPLRQRRVAFGPTRAIISKRRFTHITIALTICVAVFLGLFAHDAAAASGEKKRLAVIGIRNEIDKPEWDNQLIGYGLSKLLLQKLFDSGRYVAIEDNPEILARIDKLIEAQWQMQSSFYSPDDADRLARDLGSDVVAYAKVVKFSTKRTRGFAGPMAGAKTKVIVEIEVSLKEKGQAVRTAKGKGDAATKSMGAFFSIREDQVHFDKTTVGKAAHRAIVKAIKKLRIK